MESLILVKSEQEDARLEFDPVASLIETVIFSIAP
jgi:hypothetical protein